MNRRANASQNLIVGFGAISLAPVVGIAGQAAVIGSGFTSLGLAGLGEGTFAVIGEEVATTQLIGSPGAIVLNLAKNTWSLAQNNNWIQQIIERRIPVFLASSLSKMADESGRVRQFGREVQHLLDAGYKQAGQWLLPPK